MIPDHRRSAKPPKRLRPLVERQLVGDQAPDVNAVVLDEVVERTERLGTTLVIEATNSPDGFRDAVRAARIGGRIVLVGIPDGDVYSLPAADARRRGLTVKFSRRMGHVYPRAIDLVQNDRVDVRGLITDELTLDEGPEAFRRLAANEPGRVKAIIYPRARIADVV